MEEIPMPWSKKLAYVLLLLLIPAGAVRAQGVEESTVEAAGDVLKEIMAIPAKAIPESLLAEAQGVAIIQGMIKGSFVVGVRHGKGVLVARNAAGAWTTPVFITVTGGSVGWQAGLQATDVVVVFRNRRSVDGVLRGKFTLGADASVAAGPVGRDAAVATDARLQAELYSYSRSRGLFAGVAIDGAVMLVNHRSNAAYYAPRPGQPFGGVPGSALRLVEQVAASAWPKGAVAVNLKDVPVMPMPSNVDEVEALRAQLAENSVRLQNLLDPQWKEYLALPKEVYEGKAPPKEALDQCLARYTGVAGDARYRDLAGRAEFQETQALLIRYRSAVEGRNGGMLKLPPPPR
jgi:lipid-binding SYLF domain-containing protein